MTQDEKDRIDQLTERFDNLTKTVQTWHDDTLKLTGRVNGMEQMCEERHGANAQARSGRSLTMVALVIAALALVSGIIIPLVG